MFPKQNPTDFIDAAFSSTRLTPNWVTIFGFSCPIDMAGHRHYIVQIVLNLNDITCFSSRHVDHEHSRKCVKHQDTAAMETPYRTRHRN